MQKAELEDSNDSEGIIKPEKQNRIICLSCNEFSGYCQEDIKEMELPITRFIDCQNCGDPCIKLLGWDILTERRVGLHVLTTVNL